MDYLRTKSNANGLNAKSVIADFKTERTYQTARHLAFNSGQQNFKGMKKKFICF